MRRKKNAIAYRFAALLVIQLACSSLSPIADEPADVTIPLGPQITEKEAY